VRGSVVDSIRSPLIALCFVAIILVVIIPRLRDMSKFAAEYEEDSNKQKALVELIFKAYRALFGSCTELRCFLMPFHFL
jgi:hypothetical protein